MWKSLTENFKSFFASTPNDNSQATVRTKRKYEWDDDPDVQIVKVELKKRKTEPIDNHSVVNYLKLSASRMAGWLRPKESSNTGSAGRARNSQWVSVAPTHRNGGHASRESHLNGDGGHVNYHKNQPTNGQYGVTPSTWRSQESKPDRLDKALPRRSLPRHRGNSTASQCIRLHERQQYKQLINLQLQGHPSSWQSRPIIPPPQTVDIDNGSMTSRSRGDVSIFGTGNLSMEQHVPRYRTNVTKTPSNSNLDSSTGWGVGCRHYMPETSMASKMASLIAAQRRKLQLREHTAQASGSTSQFVTVSSGRRDSSKTSHRAEQAEQLGSTIVIDDDEQDERKSISASQTSTAAAGPKNDSKDTSERIKTDFRQSVYANEHYLDEFQNSRKMTQEQLQREIEEQTLKAKAYEEKRRAQGLSLEKELKYRMRIFDEEPQVIEEIFLEDEEEEEEETALPELTPEMETIIRAALGPGAPGEVLASEFRQQITRRDISTLGGLNWLNDEVINFYMNMLMARGEEDESRAKVYAFNTFFYPKIMSGGHQAVRRWTKKVDIFVMRYIVIPVHLGMHWCLCMVDVEDKVITYYDSMGGRNNDCLEAVRQYINDESQAKRQTPIDFSEWSLVTAQDIPQQMNGSDCGMFACKYADYITRGQKITFTQEDMPYFRRRMIYEIIHKKTLQ